MSLKRGRSSARVKLKVRTGPYKCAGAGDDGHAGVGVSECEAEECLELKNELHT